MAKVVTIMKARASESEDERIQRLTNIQTQFVSLVQRGANRQSKFFVVKADGEPPAAAAGSAPTGPDSGASNIGGHGEAERAPAADLDAWLNKAGDRVEEMIVDARIDASLATPVQPAAPAQQPQVKAQVGEQRGAPPAEAPPAGGEVALAKSQREAEELRLKLQKAEDARKQAELRAQRLRKATVGGTTALICGTVDLAEVAAAGSAGEELTEKARSAWKAGGDLAR